MMLYFEKEQRFFMLQLYQDLFGDWIVQRTNGCKQNRLGRTRKDLCCDQHTAINHLIQLARYRINRRHYQLIKVRRH